MNGDGDCIVRADDWPHGLRCGKCCRLMHNGEPYAEQLTGMLSGLPVVMIVCTGCDLAAAEI